MMASKTQVKTILESFSNNLVLPEGRQTKNFVKSTFDLWNSKLTKINDAELRKAAGLCLDKETYFPTWATFKIYVDEVAGTLPAIEYDWSKVESMSQKERDANLQYWKNYAKYYKEVVCTEEYQKELHEFLKTDKANDENATREFIDTLRRRHLEV
jgi:hypothetical protein